MNGYRYQNNNPFPITLPSARGGRVTIPSYPQPGSWTTNEWYSRFVGPKQLTRVPIGDTPVVTKAASPSGAPVAGMAPSNYQRKPPVLKDEETVDYKMQKGIYACKHCEVFRTGSLESMKAHLKEAHHKGDKVAMTTKVPLDRFPDEEPVPPPQVNTDSVPPGRVGNMMEEALDVKVDGPKQVPPRPPFDKKAADSVVEGSENEPGEPISESDVQGQAPTEENVAGAYTGQETAGSEVQGPPFECPYPGCGRKFKSQRGMTQHINRSHS